MPGSVIIFNNYFGIILTDRGLPRSRSLSVTREMGAGNMTSKIHMCRAVANCCLILIILCSFEPAQATNQLGIIVEDFKSIDGYVISFKDNDYIIDLDGSNGIQPGDIFCVLGKGEPVFHPISKKVIGNLDTIKAVLKVTRLKSGFSYARPIRNAPEVISGDPIRRYDGLKANFWDYTKKGRQLWEILQLRLPHLIWKDYIVADNSTGIQPDKLSSASVPLHFILTPDMLRVVDSELNLLHEYALTIIQDSMGATESYSYHFSRMPAGTDSSLPKSASVLKPSQNPSPQDALFDFSAAKPIGELQGSIVMADFVGKDGEIIMATTDGSGIDIYHLSEKLKLMAKTDIKVHKQILCLKWWSPAGKATPYLTASMWSDNQLTSIIFAIKNDQLVQIFQRPDSILGAFDFDGDGLPETLLSQQFAPDSFFGHRIHRLIWENEAIVEDSPNLEQPLNFTVTGSQFADLTNNGKPESVFVRNGVLNIYSGKKPLYVSPKQMGGSLSVLTYKTDPSFKDFNLTTAFFEIPPVVADIDNDGLLELLAISSDLSTFGAPGINVDIKNIRFVSIKYAEDRFIKKFLSQPFDTPVQGLAIIDKRILYIVSELRSGPGNSGHSRLFELKINT